MPEYGDEIWRARRIVSEVFSYREAQDLPIIDLFELAELISAERDPNDPNPVVALRFGT